MKIPTGHAIVATGFVFVFGLLAGCASDASHGSAPIAKGRLQVVAGSGGRISYFVESSDRPMVRLNVDRMQETMAEGTNTPINWRIAGQTQVEVFGALESDGSIDVDSMKPARMVNDGLSVLQSALSSTSGTINILVINLTLDGGQPLASTQSIKSTVDATASLLHDWSFGALTVNPTMVGPYNIRGGTCQDLYRWMDDAKAAATSAGVNTANYDHFMAIVPLGSLDCGWSGMGVVPGNSTWISELSTQVMTHELGHNLGLFHAASKTCVDTNNSPISMSSNCTMDEYGDLFDTMGGAEQALQYNAYYKSRLGWIPPENVTRASAGNHTYTVVPEDLPGRGTQLLRVRGADDADYMIELRQSNPSDPFSASDPAVNGVIIHTIFTRSSDPFKSYLLDMRPGVTGGFWGFDLGFSDAPLPVGASYMLFGTNTTVSLTSISPSGATVTITGAPDPNPTGNIVQGGIVTTNYPTGSPTDAERAPSAFDGVYSTKWVVIYPAWQHADAWVQYEFPAQTAPVLRYGLVSGNDVPGRDPRDFKLLGSNDGTTWSVLDSRTGVGPFAERNQLYPFVCQSPGAYKFYRLDVLANNGDSWMSQIAEIELYTRP